MAGARFLQWPLRQAAGGLVNALQSSPTGLRSFIPGAITCSLDGVPVAPEAEQGDARAKERAERGKYATFSEAQKSTALSPEKEPCYAFFDGAPAPSCKFSVNVESRFSGPLPRLELMRSWSRYLIHTTLGTCWQGSTASKPCPEPPHTTLLKASFPLAASTPLVHVALPSLHQALWSRHYETRSGDRVDLPPVFNRRGKRLVRRREWVDELDEEEMAGEENEGLRWMKEVVNTPRRKQAGMVLDMYKAMQNPLSEQYQLFKRATEDGDTAQDERKEEKRLNAGEDVDEFQEREYEMQIVDINNTSTATKAGRVMSVTAMVVIGNLDGIIGYGTGKALEPAVAVDKAYYRAVKNLLFVPRYRGHTIYHPVEVKFGQTKVRLWPAADGANVTASKTLGGIAHLAGIRNLKSKIIGSRHPQNVVKAIFKAFASIQTPTEIAQAFHRPVVEVRKMPFR